MLPHIQDFLSDKGNGAHINSSGGLIQDEQMRIGLIFPSENQLLGISAGKGFYILLGIFVFYGKGRKHLLGKGLNLSAV